MGPGPVFNNIINLSGRLEFSLRRGFSLSLKEAERPLCAEGLPPP